jgi:hypothetical protein
MSDPVGGDWVAISELELPGGNGEESVVVRWRRAELRRAGYGEEAAGELARRSDVDLHRAVDIVRAGCPPELANRILA